MDSEEKEPVEEMITDWGEVIPVRPGGCPKCDEKAITVHDDKCYKCGATFEPTTPL